MNRNPIAVPAVVKRRGTAPSFPNFASRNLQEKDKLVALRTQPDIRLNA
jgi:hypothetical protein